MDISTDVLVAVVSLVTAVISIVGPAVYVYATKRARKSMAKCKEEYIDNRLKELIELYKTEVKALRMQVENLAAENELLRGEVMDLKNRLLAKTEDE